MTTHEQSRFQDGFRQGRRDYFRGRLQPRQDGSSFELGYQAGLIEAERDANAHADCQNG